MEIIKVGDQLYVLMNGQQLYQVVGNEMIKCVILETVLGSLSK